MSKREITVFQKNAQKPIKLTYESDKSDQEIRTELELNFKSNKITQIETNSDILLIRPSELAGILMTKFVKKEDPAIESEKE